MNLGNAHQASNFYVGGYAILHTTMLVRMRPTATQPYSALQLVTGYEPDVSYLRIFGYICSSSANCIVTTYKWAFNKG